uniref:Uncharacterized protein n=1 Tax=Anthurium amnicola TaxID=1678845 RepID=A0A1D1Y9J8_9ARAE
MERAGRSGRGDGPGEGDGGAAVGGGSGSRWESDFVLRWGSRKRLRCVKIQVKGEAAAAAAERGGAVRVGRRRRVVGGGRDPTKKGLRRTPPHRALRKSEVSAAMKSQQQHVDGGRVTATAAAAHEGSPDDKNAENGHSTISDAAPKANGGGTAWSSGSEAAEWPKFAIALSAREKEEDFLAFKGTKLPLRPKKRAKLIQRTLNLVSPGSWLCDLTLERYEVQEKLVSKKVTPRLHFTS